MSGHAKHLKMLIKFLRALRLLIGWEIGIRVGRRGDGKNKFSQAHNYIFGPLIRLSRPSAIN